MKTIYLKINSSGNCQPHQGAKGAHYAITDCPYNESPSAIAQLANVTIIAVPYSIDITPIKYGDLGFGKFINRYADN